MSNYVIKSNGCLTRYHGKESHVTVPKDVTSIGEDAFKGCTGLTSITLPEGLTSIGENCFAGCKSLSCVFLPKSIITIKGDPFYESDAVSTIMVYQDDEVIDDVNKYPHTLWLPFSYVMKSGVKCFYDHYEIRLYHPTAANIADLLMNSHSTNWAQLVDYAMEETGEYHVSATEVLEELIRRIHNIKKTLSEKMLSGIPQFVMKHCADIVPETLSDFRDYLNEQNLTKLTNLDWDYVAKASVKKTAVSAAVHKLRLVRTDNMSDISLKSYVGNPILYADGSGIAGVRSVQTIIAYSKEAFSMAHTKVDSKYGPMLFLDAARVKRNADVDVIAKELDSDRFSAYLYEQVTSAKTHRDYLVAFGLYGTEGDIAKLCKKISWYLPNGSLDYENEAQAIFLSDTWAAEDFARKAGKLDLYISAHSMKTETYFDIHAADLGLDMEGKRVFDLGEGASVTAVLQSDFQYALHSGTDGDIVKSIPKKNADANKYEEVCDAFAKMKEDTRKAVSDYTKVLFNMFLEGSGIGGSVWKARYLNDPFLKQIARLLVWRQGELCFTVGENGAEELNGTNMQVDDRELVFLAHPMEMDAAERTEWQEYYRKKGVKQLFLQMWEPVVNLNGVKENRYCGLRMPLYRFSGMEKHGVTFNCYNVDNYDYGLWHINIYLKDCAIKAKDTRTSAGDDKKRLYRIIELGKFSMERPSRRANHIVAYLDKMLIYNKISSDNDNLEAYLEEFTQAKIMELFSYAEKNKCVNSMLTLMDYKRRVYGEDDIITEFALEW